MPGRELTKEEKLFDAVRKGKLPQVKLLLDDGIDVEARDEYGHTPLHYACMYGYPTIARMLVSGNLHGVKPATTKVHEVKLLDRGADPGVLDRYGHIPLHYACWMGHHDTATLLLDRGADVNARNEDNEIPLHYAYRKNSINVIHELLDRGADPCARDKHGKTPFDFAREPFPELFCKQAPDIYTESIPDSPGVGVSPGRGI